MMVDEEIGLFSQVELFGMGRELAQRFATMQQEIGLHYLHTDGSILDLEGLSMKKAFRIGVLVAVAAAACLLTLDQRLHLVAYAQDMPPQNLELLSHFGGQVTRVFNTNDYSYFVQGNKIVILDVSDPAQPVIVGSTEPLLAEVKDIYVVDRYAYAIVGCDLVIFDISNPDHPMRIAEPLAATSGSTSLAALYVDGEYAYILYTIYWLHPYYFTVNLSVVDVSDPLTPTLIASQRVRTDYPIYYIYSGNIVVANDLAYIVAEDYGVRILDVSNPQAPTEIGAVDIWASDISIVGQTAYVAGGSDLTVLDVSTPTSPTIISTHPGPTQRVIVTRSIAYVTSDNTLRLVDVSTPSNPITVGSYVAQGPIQDLFVSENHAYLAVYSEGMEIVDVSDVSRVTRTGHYASLGYVSDLFVKENMAYVTHSSQTMSIWDVHNPISITQSGSYDGLEQAQNILIADDVAYVVDSSEDLYLLDASVPTMLTELGRYDTHQPYAIDLAITGGYANDLAVSGGYAYILDEYYLRVWDVRNPAQPVGISSYPVSYTSRDVFADENKVYVTNYSDEIVILDVSSPISPTELGRYTGSHGIEEVFVRDGIAYVAGWSDGLVLIDVSTPTSPTEISHCELPGYASSISVVGDYAYLAAEGLRIVDISDPNDPTEVGVYDETHDADWVVATTDAAYVVNDSTLYILDVHNPITPTLLHTYTETDAICDISVADEIVYVVNASAELRLLGVSNPSAPQVLGSYSPAVDVVISGDQAYLLNDRGLQILDVGDPTHPVENGTSGSQGPINSLAVAEGVVYLASGGAGLRLLDVSNPVTPNLISTYPVLADDVFVSNGLAYLSSSTEIHILDMHTPATPTLILSYTVQVDGLFHRGDQVVADRDTVYFGINHLYCVRSCDTDGQLVALDVSDPEHPVEIGDHWMPNGIGDLIFQDGLIYVVNEESGVRVLNGQNPADMNEVGHYRTAGPATNAFVENRRVYMTDSYGGIYILAQSPQTVTGRISDFNRLPVTGVTVTASHGATATTDASGYYAFTGLDWGNYVLTPTLRGHIFYPPTRTVTAPSNASQDFVVATLPVSTTIQPGAGPHSLSYTDTQGLVTRLDFAANAVLVTTTLVLTPTIVLPPPTQAFAMHAFDLAADQEGTARFNFTFGAPVTVTIQYNEANTYLVSDDAQLALFHWTTNGWLPAVQTCAQGSAFLPYNDLQNKTIVGPICSTGRFALFGPTNQMYLPFVLHNASQ